MAPRLALVAFNDARFDSGLWRVARSARRAGFDVVIYARSGAGLPRDSVEDGIRVVRVPVPARTLVLSAIGRVVIRVPRLPVPRRRARIAGSSEATAKARAGSSPPVEEAEAVDARGGGLVRRPIRAARRWLRFPHQLLPWAVALDAVARPADIWQARLIGGLPGAVRQAHRLGGRVVYDSADV
jgi:hypothetical protein